MFSISTLDSKVLFKHSIGLSSQCLHMLCKLLLSKVNRCKLRRSKMFPINLHWHLGIDCQIHVDAFKSHNSFKWTILPCIAVALQLVWLLCLLSQCCFHG